MMYYNKNMANLFDYLTWRGDLHFKHTPFNPVDNIIFSQLSYLPFDGIVSGPEKNERISIGRASEIFIERMEQNTLEGAVMFKNDPEFIKALGQAERFRNCELYSYVNHIDIIQEKQFAAMCVDTGTLSYAVYRGTDASLVGWKEDFNMGLSGTIPSQLEAVSYLKNAVKKSRAPLFVGGHSKGGNLAVYAAASSPPKIRKKIAGVYSNDAPGFHRNIIESEGFKEIQRRVYSYVPQFSVVGMLFEHGVSNMVIKSSQSGIMQHSLYSWEVSHNDLIHLEGVSPESRFIGETLREWLDGLDYGKRQQFIETLYTVLSAARVESIPELGDDWLKSTGLMLQSLGSIDRSTRANIRKTIAALFRAARNNIDTLLPTHKTISPAEGQITSAKK